MRKYLELTFIFLLMPTITLAADGSTNRVIEKMKRIGNTLGPYEAANEFTLAEIIGVIISAALALLGAIFLALMLYAGYHWLTARGEEEKVEQAKDTINRATVGLIIVVGVYAIWQFVFSELILK